MFKIEVWKHFILIKIECIISAIKYYFIISDNLDIVHKSCDVQNLENVISFIKPKRKLLNYNPDTNIKFGPPDATSTIKHKVTQSDSM